MYVNDLNGAKPVVWKPEITLCPPDCGGKDYDEIDYEAHCPECDRAFTPTDRFNFCPTCGTKIWLNVTAPVIHSRK